MDYYLSENLNFKVPKKICLGEVEGFLIVEKKAYYRAVRRRLQVAARNKKDFCVMAAKVATAKTKLNATRLKDKTVAAVKAFKS